MTLPLRPFESAPELSAEARMHELEAELLEAGHELARVHRELEVLRERLRRESAERADLLDAVGHDLRTPLTVIGGYHRLLLGDGVGPLNEKQRKFLEESLRSCQRLDAFLANMLAASRFAHGGEVFELGRAPLAPAIEAVAAMFEPLLAERGQRLSLALDPAAAEARFDPPRVEQVLTNLVGNAVKFARAGGSIEIATRAFSAPGHEAVRRWVEISVSDDGPGIAPEHRERVFGLFQRVGGDGGGAGVGLALCKRAIEKHGGRIWVESTPGAGSTFYFSIPA